MPPLLLVKLNTSDFGCVIIIFPLPILTLYTIQRLFHGLQVTNDIGEDSGKLDVEVVDCPSSPRNLTVTDVAEDSVSISWEIPEDDGGSPITGYIVEKRDATR